MNRTIYKTYLIWYYSLKKLNINFNRQRYEFKKFLKNKLELYVGIQYKYIYGF